MFEHISIKKQCLLNTPRNCIMHVFIFSFIRMMNILLVALFNEFNSICVNYEMNEFSVSISANLDRDYDVFAKKVADFCICVIIVYFPMGNDKV